MISRGIVKIDGALSKSQSEDLGVKINVTLRIARDGGDMMDAPKFHNRDRRLTSFPGPIQRMYLWRRLAGQKWWSDNKKELRARAGDQLAIIERPNHKRVQLEVVSQSRVQLQTLAQQFDGRIEKLPRNWLKRFLSQKTKPLKVGSQRLIIPAGAAFGTGEHATTAMSLRLLEKLTRNWKPGWSIVDLGTGSGILALAAKRFEATRVIGIDSDPTAISTAKENARANKVHDVNFRVDDVRRCKLGKSRLRGTSDRGQVDVVTANLFSDLLIEILPKLKAARWLILSGVLREQERDVTLALKRNKIDILQLHRRGKWVAILAVIR